MTVTFAGWDSGGYGNLVVIDRGSPHVSGGIESHHDRQGAKLWEPWRCGAPGVCFCLNVGCERLRTQSETPDQNENRK